jgi:hypothetical protein
MMTDLATPKATRRARPKEIPLERFASRSLLAPGQPLVNEALARAGKIYAEMFGREKLATDDMLACWFSVDERHRAILDDILIEEKMPREIYRKYCNSKREKTGVAAVMHQLIEALRELARYLGYIEQRRQSIVMPTQAQIDAARAQWPNAIEGSISVAEASNIRGRPIDDLVTEAPSSGGGLLDRLEAAQVEIAALGDAAKRRPRTSPLAVALRLVRT